MKKKATDTMKKEISPKKLSLVCFLIFYAMQSFYTSSN